MASSKFRKCCNCHRNPIEYAMMVADSTRESDGTILISNYLQEVCESCLIFKLLSNETIQYEKVVFTKEDWIER